jgi:DNA-binding transcriptional MerR regulator
MKSYIDELRELLEDWNTHPNQSKRIINALVEYLTEDIYWLQHHISDVDREILREAVGKL